MELPRAQWGKSTYNAGDVGFDLWVGEDSLEEGTAIHPNILVWRVHGQRSLCLQSIECKESQT